MKKSSTLAQNQIEMERQRLVKCDFDDLTYTVIPRFWRFLGPVKIEIAKIEIAKIEVICM